MDVRVFGWLFGVAGREGVFCGCATRDTSAAPAAPLVLMLIFASASSRTSVRSGTQLLHANTALDLTVAAARTQTYPATGRHWCRP